jgi:hypothetical protein
VSYRKIYFSHLGVSVTVGKRLFSMGRQFWDKLYTGYFTSDNDPCGIENATHNTLECKHGYGGDKYPAFPSDVLWLEFSIPPGSLSLVKYSVFPLLSSIFLFFLS